MNIKMQQIDQEIFTVDQLAKLFCCDSETVASRLISGDLPGLKVGRSWLIPRQALIDRINQKANDEAAIRRNINRSLNDQKIKNTDIAFNAYEEDPKERSISPLLPTSSLKVGRKRRLPPTLPKISSITGKN